MRNKVVNTVLALIALAGFVVMLMLSSGMLDNSSPEREIELMNKTIRLEFVTDSLDAELERAVEIISKLNELDSLVKISLDTTLYRLDSLSSNSKVTEEEVNEAMDFLKKRK